MSSDWSRPAGTGVSKRIDGKRARLETCRDELRAAIKNQEMAIATLTKGIAVAKDELSRIEKELA